MNISEEIAITIKMYKKLCTTFTEVINTLYFNNYGECYTEILLSKND